MMKTTRRSMPSFRLTGVTGNFIRTYFAIRTVKIIISPFHWHLVNYDFMIEYGICNKIQYYKVYIKICWICRSKAYIEVLIFSIYFFTIILFLYFFPQVCYSILMFSFAK